MKKLYLFAHAGEGHTQTELNSGEHTETSTTHVSRADEQSPSANDQGYAWIFLGVIIAAICVGMVFMLKSRFAKKA